MFAKVYAEVEGRIVDWETTRRGARHAARLRADAEAIGSLAELEAQIGDAEVISFDLFDTLILRRGLSLEAIERKTAGYARAIAGRAAGEAVWAARRTLGQAMKRADLASGRGDEPSLEAIFTEALRLLGGVGAPDAIARRLARFEGRVDAKGIVAAPGAVALLERLRDRGLRVVAVTDMYHSEAVIRHVLAAAGLEHLFEAVFVSADLGWTKRGGRIFPLVAAKLGVAPGRILHVGDREDSDVIPARAAGWRAVHLVDRGQIAATEAARIAESHIPSPALRQRRLIKALDMADPSALGTPERIVEQLFGPAAGLLALSALSHAGRIGARRLFHLTRDATVIGEIAKEACRRHPHLAPEDLQISDLAMSRSMGARLQIRCRQDHWKIGHLTPYLSEGHISGAAMISGFGLREELVPEEVCCAEGAAFIAALEQHGEAVETAFRAAREETAGYLQKTGILGAGPSVAVDIGYSGTAAVQLSDLFFDTSEDNRRLDFLMLFTSRYYNGNAWKLHPQIRMSPGLALDHRKRHARWATWNFAWAEPFFVEPDRGRLLGYDADGPRFAPSPFVAPVRERHAEIRAAIIARALRFMDDFHGAPGDLDEAATLLQARFARFAGCPRRSEVAAVTALSHQKGQTNVEVQDISRFVNPLRLHREIKTLKDDDRWVQGSLAQSYLGIVNRVMADGAERDARADPRQPSV